MWACFCCLDTTYNGRGACYNRTDMYAEYAKAADIVSFDIYPTNSDNPAVKDKLWMVRALMQFRLR